MSEHPGHASPLHPSLSHQVCRRDSDVKRAERGTVAWPKLQHLCPGTRRIPEPPQALRAPSISHPSMGNEAQSVQWAVHTCAIITKLIMTRQNKGCQTLLLTSGCWNTSIGNGGLSPLCTSGEGASSSVSGWFLPGLHLWSCTECSPSWMALGHCSTVSAHKQPRV